MPLSHDTRTPKPTDTAVSQHQRWAVESRRSSLWQGVVYQRERRACGKSCKTCLQEGGHGPYWFAYWHDSQQNKTRSRYIGKQFREITSDEF